MTRLELSFIKALQRFEEALQESTKTEIVRDATIQRFEFTVEMAWKAVQKRLRVEQIICRSPRECLKEAFSFGLIQDDPRWLKMFEDRNLASHTYDEETAQAIYERLPGYLEPLRSLAVALKGS